MKNQRVLAVVLTYNRKTLLKKVLDALLMQNSGAPDILVVDNHSTDGTREMIAPYVEENQIVYEDTGSNLGGAGGFHYCLKKSAQMGYDRIWVMDDDCIPQEGALAALLQADRDLHGEFGWLSSLAYWTDGTLCKLNEHDYALGKRIKDFSKPIVPAITASFVSLYMSPSVIFDVGLNIKEFYMWADDWEFTRRISRKYSCYVVSDSKVTHATVHNHGNNIATDCEDRIWRYEYAYRNEVYVLRQDGARGMLHWAMKMGYHSMRILVQSKGYRLKKLSLMYKSAWKGFFFHPNIEYIKGVEEVE